MGAKNRRVLVARYGGPEVLQIVEEYLPEPARGEVRVKVLAAGVSLPDLMAREGIHPETPRVPYTPGWDLVGVVDKLGDGVDELQPGQCVAAMPISGAQAEFVCLPRGELVPVPQGLAPPEAVSVVLNYVTAYQMMHRCVPVKPGQRVLIHGAAGGVGTALMQLGRLSGLEMYGTCSASGEATVSSLGGVAIDYKKSDFVREIRRMTGDGVDVAYDGVGGDNIWRSREALRSGGRVVAFGLTASLCGGRALSNRTKSRDRWHAVRVYAWPMLASWLLPGRRRVVPYSIQWLKRLRPALFRQDLTVLLNLLRDGKIKPIVAERLPLSEVRRAHELLARGGVAGKIVLVNS